MPNADSVSTDSFLWVQFKNFLRSSDKKSNDQLFRVSNDAQVQTRRPVVIFIEGKENIKIKQISMGLLHVLLLPNYRSTVHFGQP